MLVYWEVRKLEVSNILGLYLAIYLIIREMHT